MKSNKDTRRESKDRRLATYGKRRLDPFLIILITEKIPKMPKKRHSFRACFMLFFSYDKYLYLILKHPNIEPRISRINNFFETFIDKLATSKKKSNLIVPKKDF